MGESGRICNVCANTDFALALDPSRWPTTGPDGRALTDPDDRTVVHHPSIASLRSSALQGCPTCLFFMELLKQPLRLQEPEPWGRFEAIDSQKKKKAAKRAFDDARRLEELHPCKIRAIKVDKTHGGFAPPNGAVGGFWYGTSYSLTTVGVIGSDSSPENIGTRNLWNHTDTGLCREWLKQCQSEHPDCPPISDTDLPTRLIDIGDPSNGTHPRLVETSGQKGQYVTLSHCWGRSKPPSTTKANLSDQMLSMPLKSMPKTFRDALNLVRRLGFRFIWIDSYCIIQDDEADWQRECASMAAVYHNCVVTLAAPFAIDCHAGFSRGLHPVPAEIWCDLPVHWLGATSPDLIRVIHPYDWNDGRVDWDESPLAERAWALQENLLSPRWLYFGKESLYFECSTAQFDEHLRVPLKLSTRRVGTYFYAPKNLLNFTTYGEGLSSWYMMISAYSNLCLTYESDRLSALSGIASMFATRLGDEYIAGLWRKDIVFGLLFKVDPRGKPFRSEKPSSVSGPSWSWYSCDRRVHARISSPVRFTVEACDDTYDRTRFSRPECFGPLIKVISLPATPKGENSFGAVSNARLTVMGRLQRAWLSHGQIHFHKDSRAVGKLSPDDPSLSRAGNYSNVLMLPIAISGDWIHGGPRDWSWDALALAEVPNEPQTYRRVGLIDELDRSNQDLVGSDDRSKWEIWEFLFAPQLQQLHLI